MQGGDEYKVFFNAIDLLFEGNKFWEQKYKVPFKEFNNDVVNKEKEKELEQHFIKWYKHVNNYPDSDD